MRLSSSSLEKLFRAFANSSRGVFSLRYGGGKVRASVSRNGKISLAANELGKTFVYNFFSATSLRLVSAGPTLFITNTVEMVQFLAPF